MKVGLWDNVGKQTVESYGLFRVTGQTTTDTGRMILRGVRPDGLPGLHLVNKGTSVSPGKRATFFQEEIHPLRYDSEDSPAVGDRLGPTSDTSAASPHGDGWIVIRPDEDKTDLVIVTRSTGSLGLFALVETTEDHAQGDTQDCYVLSGPKGAEERIAKVPEDAEDPYITIVCFNRFSDLVAEQQAVAAYVINGWELIAASCED